MQMFRWDSEALKNYSRGDIVAIGSTVDEARANARVAFEAYAKDSWAHLTGGYGYEDDDDRAQMQEKRDLFERDLAATPETANAFCFRGSD